MRIVGEVRDTERGNNKTLDAPSLSPSPQVPCPLSLSLSLEEKSREIREGRVSHSIFLTASESGWHVIDATHLSFFNSSLRRGLG